MSDHDPSPTSAPLRRLPGRQGVTLEDVIQAADAILRRGDRPTIDRVRAELGRGSPNTVNPFLDQWWARLGARLQVGPAALQRLPEGALRILEGLWVQVLEDARRQATDELGAARKTVDQARGDIAARSHVLSLREGELEKQLLERGRTLDAMQAQLSGVAALLARASAEKESAERRLVALESELADVRGRITQMLAEAVTARRRARARTPPKRSRPSSPKKTTRRRVLNKKPPRRPPRKSSRRRSR